jgi:hypothetical protein
MAEVKAVLKDGLFNVIINLLSHYENTINVTLSKLLLAYLIEKRQKKLLFWHRPEVITLAIYIFKRSIRLPKLAWLSFIAVTLAF